MPNKLAVIGSEFIAANSVALMPTNYAGRVVYGKGHILSRRLVRHHNKDMVELWLATDDGPVCVYSPPQKNVCFVLKKFAAQAYRLIAEHNLAVGIEDTHLTTLEHQPLCLLRLSSDSLSYELRRLFSSYDITLYESDIKLSDRFLMERFAYGSVSFRATDINGALCDAQIKGIEYRPTLTSLSLDIECDEHENLFSIGLAGNALNHVLLIYDKPVSSLNEDYTLEVVPDERTLLVRLCELIGQADPDVITGWNIKQFDCAVLARKAASLGLPLAIGRAGHVLQVKAWNSGHMWVDAPGRSIIDGIEALKTMTYQFESFSLDAVAHSLLGSGKLVKDNNQIAAIKSLYKKDPARLADYNYCDCELVNKIADKSKFIDFLILRSTLTGLDLSRPGGSVAAFINVYLPHLHRKGYVCGIRPDDGGLASPGGYVMDSKPGLYNYVIVLDFKSLYPSIIRTFKIDPMGLAEGLKSPDKAIPGYKEACFSRTEHFLPDIIANLWQQRDDAKKANDAPRSQAIKILMNSFYGVLGSGGCPFYDPRLASSITLRGHNIMQTTASWIEQRGLEVIYGDTDSLFINLPDIDNRYSAIEVGQQLEQEINHAWKERLKHDFQLPCFLELEFETCFDRFFMPTIRGATTGSKKRYAGLVSIDDEQHLIMKGLESVRSDWTPLAKRFQKQLYLKIFHGEPVEHFVRQTILDIRDGKCDAELVYQKRLRKPLAEYTRARPPHVKAALLIEKQQKNSEITSYIRPQTTVRYVITRDGPQPEAHLNSAIDYEHYIEKQIQPIAESILPYANVTFDQICDTQLDLF